MIPFILRERFCVGQLSRSLQDPGLPTFLYHWETFLSLLTSFFPCNFHPVVTKTVLSTNTWSVYLCSLNAIQSLSTGISWLFTTILTKHCSIDNSFIFLQNQNKHEKQLLCKERNIFLFRRMDTSQGNTSKMSRSITGFRLRYFLFCSTFVLSFMIAKLKTLFHTNNEDLS